MTIKLAFLKVFLIIPVSLLYSKSQPLQSPLTITVPKCRLVPSSLSTHLYTSIILLVGTYFQTNIANLKKKKKR